MKNNKGSFITFEGPEGSGKTTVLILIQEKLEKQGEQVVVTREPGGIAIAEEIRSIILNEKNTMMDAKTEALLYAAARRQHLVERVVPAIADDKIVLCDRFIDSSLAYQGVARGLGIDNVLAINEFAIDGVMPHLTIFFDIQPEEGLARIAQANRETNRLDQEGLDFHKRVYKGYIKVCKRYPSRIVKIDAAAPIEEVVENVWNILKTHRII